MIPHVRRYVYAYLPLLGNFSAVGVVPPSFLPRVPGWNAMFSGRKKTLDYFQSTLQISKRSAVHLICEFSRTYNELIDILILLVYIG